jgi:hypothetical protein
MSARNPGLGPRLRVPFPQRTKKKKTAGIRILGISIILLVALFVVLTIISMLPIEERPSSGVLYLLGSTFGLPMNRSSPSDFIKEEDIEIYSDKIIIRIPGAILSRYASTGSMLQIISHTANGIEIPFTSTSQVNVGDIIAFIPMGSNELIVHRIVEIGQDNEGWYCITKGDNNNQTDGKIREEQIKFITIGIFY